MSGGKGAVTNQPVDPPQLAGLNPQLLDTQQATIPSTYFAGARRLKLLWIMNPVDMLTYPSAAGTGKSKGGTSANSSNDYIGSIAAITNCGQLDFVWGILQDDGVVFPNTSAFDDTLVTPIDWPINSFVVYLGKIWTNPSVHTTNKPPAAPWVIYKQDISSNPTQFVLPNRGYIWIYKGTETQVLDPAAEKFLTLHGHPPYRYRALACLTNYFFGTEIQSPPNISILGARNPTQSIITGAAAALDADWQANPWACISELLTHPVYGAGILASQFHTASWQSEADWCYARAATTYISPLYESQTKVRSIVADLLAYVDGFVFWGSDGLLHCGHWPHGEAAPGGMLNLTWNDVVEEIGWDTDSWQATTNSGTVNFNDAQAAFQPNSVPVMNGYNRQVTRRVQLASIDRPFITRKAQAAAWAAELGKINGDTFFSAQIVVRKERVTNLSEGDLFTLTDDLVQVTKVCRCLGKTISAQPAGTVTLKIESERGVADVPYRATPPDATNMVFPSPSRITNFQLFQLPGSLAGQIAKVNTPTGYEVACIAGRNDALTNRLDVWWKYAGASFQLINTQTIFGVGGALNATSNGADVVHEAVTASSTQGNSYPLANQDLWNLLVEYDHGAGYVTATPVTDYSVDLEAGIITVITGGGIPNTSAIRASYSIFVKVLVAAGTPDADIATISAALTADDIADNSLLLFVSQAATPGAYEIITIKSVTATIGVPGGYTLGVVRQRYGTPFGGDGSYVFTTADPAFIIWRKNISQFTHVSFADLYAALATATFRLTPATAWKEADVIDVYDAITNPNGLTTETTLTFGDPWAPLAAWTGLFANTGTAGAMVAITSFASAFAPATIFQFTAQLTSPMGQLRSYSLASIVGSVRTIVDSGQLSGGQVTKSVSFTLTGPGQYAMELDVTDTAGRITTIPLTLIGSGTERQILIQSASPTQVASPLITVTVRVPRNPTQGATATITDSTAGATIYYQIQPIGTAPSGSVPAAPWAVYSAPLSLPYGTAVYSIATHAGLAGLADSNVVTAHQ